MIDIIIAFVIVSLYTVGCYIVYWEMLAENKFPVTLKEKIDFVILVAFSWCSVFMLMSKAARKGQLDDRINEIMDKKEKENDYE